MGSAADRLEPTDEHRKRRLGAGRLRQEIGRYLLKLLYIAHGNLRMGRYDSPYLTCETAHDERDKVPQRRRPRAQRRSAS